MSVSYDWQRRLEIFSMEMKWRADTLAVSIRWNSRRLDGATCKRKSLNGVKKTLN